jgi:cell division septal protein FtsQ
VIVVGIRKKYWWYLAATVMMTGLMAFVQLSPVFAVRRTEIRGPFAEKLDKYSNECLRSGENLFRLDRKALAGQMLTSDKVEKVYLSYSLPHGLCAEVNRFDPAALVLIDGLYGLDCHCRLLPFDSAWKNIDLPILTGLKNCRLFKTPPDFRLAGVMSGLLEIKDNMPELYRQIAEINFSDNVYVSIYLTTGTDRYLATTRDFTAQLIKLDIARRTVTRSDNGCYNLSYDGLVIRQR